MLEEMNVKIIALVITTSIVIGIGIASVYDVRAQGCANAKQGSSFMEDYMCFPSSGSTRSPASGDSAQLKNPAGTKSNFNWLKFCQSVDALITEPCETLTTPDGYTLTSEGNRVFLVCIGGGALATLLGQPELVPQLSAVGKCGSTSQSGSDTITGLLKDSLGISSR